jgi:hypothetical protein
MFRAYVNHVRVYYVQKRQTGVEPKVIDFYKTSHTKKDGPFVTPLCEERYVSH